MPAKPSNQSAPSTTVVTLECGQCLADTDFGPEPKPRNAHYCQPAILPQEFRQSVDRPPYLSLDLCAVARWEHPSRAFKIGRGDAIRLCRKVVGRPLFQKDSGKDVPWQPIAQAYFVSERIEDWHDPMQTQFTIFALCLVTALYGGLHAAAWNAKFPTPTECLLLRISALVIVSTGLGYVTGQLLYQHLDEPRRSLKARAPLWH